MTWSGEQIMLLCFGNVDKMRVVVGVAGMSHVDRRILRIAMGLEVSHVLGDVLGLGTDVGVVGWLKREAETLRDGDSPFRVSSAVCD